MIDGSLVMEMLMLRWENVWKLLKATMTECQDGFLVVPCILLSLECLYVSWALCGYTGIIQICGREAVYYSVWIIALYPGYMLHELHLNVSCQVSSEA